MTGQQGPTMHDEQLGIMGGANNPTPGPTMNDEQLGIMGGANKFQNSPDFRGYLSRLQNLFPGMNVQGGQQNAGQMPNFNQTQPISGGAWEGGTGFNRATMGRVV